MYAFMQSSISTLDCSVNIRLVSTINVHQDQWRIQNQKYFTWKFYEH